MRDFERGLRFVIVTALAGCAGKSTSQNATPPVESASGGAAESAGTGGLGRGGRSGDGGVTSAGRAGSFTSGHGGVGEATGGGGTLNGGPGGEGDNAGDATIAGWSGTGGSAGFANGVGGAAGIGGRFDAGGTLSGAGRHGNPGGAGGGAGASGGVAGASGQTSCPMTLEERCAQDDVHCVSMLSAAEEDAGFCTPSAGEWTCGGYQAVIPMSVDASVVYYYDETGTLIAIGRIGGVSGVLCLGGPSSIELTGTCSDYVLLPACDS